MNETHTPFDNDENAEKNTTHFHTSHETSPYRHTNEPPIIEGEIISETTTTNTHDSTAYQTETISSMPQGFYGPYTPQTQPSMPYTSTHETTAQTHTPYIHTHTDHPYTPQTHYQEQQAHYTYSQSPYTASYAPSHGTPYQHSPYSGGYPQGTYQQGRYPHYSYAPYGTNTTTMPPYWHQTYGAPQKKNNKSLFVALGIFLLVAFLAAGGSIFYSMKANTASSIDICDNGSLWCPEQSNGDSHTDKNNSTDENDLKTKANQQTKAILIITTEVQGGIGAGTGMIISEDGYAITNYHVVEGSTQIQVTTGEEKQYTAKVVGRNADVDIAVLKIDSDETLPAIQFDNNEPSVGDKVFALGNANGQGYLSELQGRVTAVNQTITVTDEDGSTHELQNLIETNTAIVPGYSGGPLFNSQGNVIGVDVAGSSRNQGRMNGQGYSIPAKDALAIVEQIKSGSTEGNTKTGPNGALGIQVQDSTAGVQIVQVLEGSAAEKAGLQAKDIITAVDDTQVTTASALAQEIRDKGKGTKVSVTFLRGHKEQTLDVVLGESDRN
ncbi:MAG: trypsin-like peptidase domain-containing protein [Actinomycetaceae bacterium]|nr:trypsin-like peptidase domain-containing protein [Actinomycetaceae bacterium]